MNDSVCENRRKNNELNYELIGMKSVGFIIESKCNKSCLTSAN